MKLRHVYNLAALKANEAGLHAARLSYGGSLLRRLSGRSLAGQAGRRCSLQSLLARDQSLATREEERALERRYDFLSFLSHRLSLFVRL